MVDLSNDILMYYLMNLLFFGIPVLYYCTDLNSSVICFFSGNICLFFGISVSSLATSKLLCDDCFETLVILSAILLPIKSPVAPAVFWITLFEAVFITCIVDFLALSKSFWLYLLLKFLPTFLTNYKNR